MIHPHRIFLKYKDIQVLECCSKPTAITRLKRIKNIFKCNSVTIRNYAEFHAQNEAYIIEQMTNFKLI